MSTNRFASAAALLAVAIIASKRASEAVRRASMRLSMLCCSSLRSPPSLTSNSYELAGSMFFTRFSHIVSCCDNNHIPILV